MQLPADTMVTVAPATEHTAGVVLPNTTGLPDAPPVAETANVPFGANTGADGLAANPPIACVARAIAIEVDTVVAAAWLSSPGWSAAIVQLPADSIVTVVPLIVHTDAVCVV